jgi:hypothetical protein
MMAAIVNMNHFGEGLMEKLEQKSSEEEMDDGNTYAFQMRR